MLCKRDKCRWYSEAKPGGRKCYYGDPQCWRGWFDCLAAIFKIRFGKRR